ncbi:MAG: Mur ligase family protein, partial [Bacteroidota bacterium]
MQYSIRQIATITDGSFLNTPPEQADIEHILFDSRQITFPASSLFVALEGRHFDGHDFIKNAFTGGIRNFLVSKEINSTAFRHANFILVQNTLAAFQKIAAYHRSQFSFPIIGITGSNGKTIVKEWLFQLLNDDFHIVRNPKSYNSQIGVPISILQIKGHHDLGIFEAGISQMREMEKLASIIKPDIGIFTTLGEAHSEGFPDKVTKLREKLHLFKNVKTLIYRRDDEMVHREIGNWKSEIGKHTNLVSWSTKNRSASYFVEKTNKTKTGTEITTNYQLERSEIPHQQIGIPTFNKSLTVHHSPFTVNFTDDASIENAIHCHVLMHHLGYNDDIISERMAKLEPVAMRLELKEGINGCTIINDSYNSDLNSLKIALDFLNQQSTVSTHTLILSDILQSGQPKEKLYSNIAKLIIEKNIDKIIGIGNDVATLNDLLPENFNKLFLKNTDLFLEKINADFFNKEAILLKGARLFHFEKIANQLAIKIHQTALEVNLTSLLNNLRVYQQHLLPGTKMMVMVKASAYGSGSVEVAKLLEFQQVDYLAVAYADEGVELRKAGIQLPILVLNPEEVTFKHLIKYRLEPEIYHFNLLKKYLHFLKSFSKKEIFYSGWHWRKLSWTRDADQGL